MTKPIRFVGVLILGMFLLLFAASTFVQFINRDELESNAFNRRAQLNEYEVQRGPILVDGTPIVTSVPIDNDYKWQRKYLEPELYAAVTGYYTLGQGSAGVERGLNKELSGRADSQFFSYLQRLFTGKHPAGSAVELTLDPVAQKAAFEAMGNYEGAIVVMDATSGDILAMVSTPSYNPNALASHNYDEVSSAYKALEADPQKPLENRATGGRMDPPGSTFKLVVAASAIENGIVTPDAPLPNPSEFQLPGSTAVVYNPEHGSPCGPGETTTLREAIRRSCNIPFAQLAIELGQDKLMRTAEGFGFNHRFELPVATDASIFPTQPMDSAQLGLTGFGQFDLRATPLQMAAVSASMINGGAVMDPSLVSRILTPELQEIEGPKETVFKRPISAQTADTMRDLMIDSVKNGYAQDASVDGAIVGGKTGTAQNGDNAPYSLWYTGFAQKNNKNLAIAVVIQNDGGKGSHQTSALAVEVGQRVMKAVLS